MENPIKYQVIVSQNATKKLVQHVAFLARVNEKAADRLVESLKITV